MPMKRGIAAILSALLLFALPAAASAAPAEPSEAPALLETVAANPVVSIVVDDAPVWTGGTFTAELTMSRRLSFHVLSLQIKYDTDALELAAVEWGDAIKAELSITSETLAVEPYAMVWSATGGGSCQKGTIATLTFRVKDAAAAGEQTIQAGPYLGSGGDWVDNENTNIAMTFLTSGEQRVVPLNLDYGAAAVTVLARPSVSLAPDGGAGVKAAVLHAPEEGTIVAALYSSDLRMKAVETVPLKDAAEYPVRFSGAVKGDRIRCMLLSGSCVPLCSPADYTFP